MEEKMTDEEKTKITSSLDELKEAHSSRDIEKIKEKMEEVNQNFQEVSMRLYTESQAQSSSETTEETEDREVTDVDFEEVEVK